ncbi:MAG: tripartite tricarboxylate transporter TctB family protein [Telmatospirillum sp.]|nr:tripartite tricarboxylate transporter TctB family protein [Telmatospirillum sp.]
MSAPQIRQWVGDAAVGIFLAAAGGTYLWLGQALPKAAAEPGPGALPRFLGAALIVVGIGCALRAWRARKGEDEAAIVALWERNALACAVALLAACFAFEPVGFVPTVALFLGFVFWRLGVLKPFAAALAGTAGAAILWGVFSFALGVGLPASLLGLGG